jgi:four helix bundle protein
MKTRCFRDLLVWQQAMNLTRGVYEAAQKFPKREIFGLSSQVCRAAVSVPSNIAEGHGRSSDKSFALFLAQARGSLNELETQLEIAGGLGYISSDRLQDLLTESAEVGRMLNGLLRALSSTENR